MTLYKWIKKAARLSPVEIARRGSAFLVGVPTTVLRISRIIHSKKPDAVRFVVLVEHLGDVVSVEPLIRRLREPGLKLVWVIRREYSDAVRNVPIVELLEVNSLTEWKCAAALFPKLNILSLHFDNHLCGCFGIAFRNRNARGISDDNYYNVGNLLKIRSVIAGVEFTDERPIFYVRRQLRVDTILEKFKLRVAGFIAIHATSNDVDRTWPAERFSELADWILSKTELAIVEFGLGPVLLPSARVILLRDGLPIESQALLLSQARLFVGGDSGFAHIANAFAVPAVLVMGRFRKFTNHMPFSGPWACGQGCIFVRTQGRLSTLPAKPVIEAVGKMLGSEQLLL